MRHIYYTIIIGLVISVGACTPMDDKYTEFVEGGPITYIAKVSPDSILVNGGRERIQFSWPRSNDPRGEKAIIYWSNRMGTKEVDINPNGRTEFVIDQLAEGSYIFEIVIVDDEGNSSIPVTLTGDVYGDLYEKYLMNRALTGVSVGTDADISFAEIVDKTIVGTEFDWNADGDSLFAFADSSSTTFKIAGFEAMSFRYRTVYEPGEGAIDQFYSPYAYYVMNANKARVSYSRLEKKFSFPEIKDGHWMGIEIAWNDKTTGEEQIFVLQNKPDDEVDSIAVIPNYAGREIRYRAFYQYGEETVYSSAETFSTVAYLDLDRSAWSSTQSHNRPVDAAITNAANSHIDGDYVTCLSLVKPGKSFGGITPGNDAIVYFIVDMGIEQEFDYFRIRHRNSSTSLRVRKVALYGSNDGTNYSIIKDNIEITSSGSGSVMEERIDLPLSSYRYVKQIYLDWDAVSGNTMQIAEVYLGIVD